MTRRPRRNHTPAFKAKVALAALKGEKTLAELEQQASATGTQSHHCETEHIRQRLSRWPFEEIIGRRVPELRGSGG